MILEFNIYKLKQESKMYKRLVEKDNGINEFIIIGEEDEYFKVQQLYENGLIMIGGLKIDESAYHVLKSDLENKVELGWEIQEIDVPREYLTMDIIENIQRLNN